MYCITGGAKLYYIPESKAYNKLGEPGIMLHCVKHNQHVQHANARGSGGMSPKKIMKTSYRCSEIEFEGISESKYLYNVQ